MLKLLYLKLVEVKCINDTYRNAWNGLGDMPQEVAMEKYVDEMKNVRMAPNIVVHKYI